MLAGDAAALYDRKATAGLHVDDSAIKCFEAAKDSPADQARWVLLGYDAAAKDHITLVAEGDGGYPELQKHWKDDDVQYGMCAFWVGGRRQFFFVSSVGESVTGMRKAKASLHKAGVYKAFNGLVQEVGIADAGEGACDAVLALLRAKASGAPVAFALP